ncbi:MAG: ATP synthase F1 subunit gamma [Clostridia bacterium]|nr:ATP synthase F1 subunit gamma [Clostridia bacterium]
MPSLKAIKRRINSVDTTKKIMKAMDMVAAAKLQKVKARLDAARLFAQEAKNMLAAFDDAGELAENVFFAPRAVKHTVYLIITSDRGLCGSHNANLIEKLRAHIRENKIEHERIIAVGSKGYDYFTARGKYILRAFPDVSETVLYVDAIRVADYVAGLYTSGEADEVYMAYTKFESALSHSPQVSKVFPMSVDVDPEAAAKSTNMAYDPDMHSFLDHAMPVFLNAFVYAALIESSACEQAARMMSMEAAVNNASEIIGKLTRSYNRRRQSVITQEISEIVSSASIMK